MKLFSAAIFTAACISLISVTTANAENPYLPQNSQTAPVTNPFANANQKGLFKPYHIPDYSSLINVPPAGAPAPTLNAPAPSTNAAPGTQSSYTSDAEHLRQLQLQQIYQAKMHTSVDEHVPPPVGATKSPPPKEKLSVNHSIAAVTATGDPVQFLKTDFPLVLKSDDLQTFTIPVVEQRAGIPNPFRYTAW